MQTFLVGGVEVTVDDLTVQWRAGMSVDADGCPRAYKLPDDGPDDIRSAGPPGNRYGVVCGRDGKEIVQGPNDPAPGYLVSTTAYVDHSRDVNDPLRYVDASVVPYGSIPPDLFHFQGQPLLHMGDVGIATYKGVSVAFCLADVGPHGKLWEASIAAAAALDIDSSPRHGGVGSGVSVVVWRGSSRPWPRTAQSIADQVAQLMSPKTA